jgi:hypothetical protein
MPDNLESDLDAAMRSAVAEICAAILGRYPEATFDLSRGVDEPEQIHLTAIVDLDKYG